MTLQEHLPRELPAYEVTKRPVKVFKVGPWWIWEHLCLHGHGAAQGQPHTTHEWALLYGLKHWDRCR